MNTNNRKMVKRVKCNTTGKDGFKQLEINQFFSSSSKGTACNKMKLSSKSQKCSRQLFTESNTTIVVHDSDSDLESKQSESQHLKSDFVEKWKIPVGRIIVDHRSLPVPMLDETDADKDLIIDVSRDGIKISKVLRSSKINTENLDKTNLTVNKPYIKFKTPEKIKPRILQAKLSNESVSPESIDSNETVIYDVVEATYDENSAVNYYSPTTKLITTIEKNVESTKLSSIAYKRSEPVCSPQKILSKNQTFRDPNKSQSPSKSPRTSKKKKPPEDDDEYVNPRVVILVTKIIKYVFAQPHLKVLFAKEEVSFLQKFYDAPRPEYNYLCYKLFTRLPKWYNIFKLSENIRLDMHAADIVEMYKFLGENEFVHTDYTMEPVEQLLNLLQRNEIKELCDSFKLKLKSGTKPHLIEQLIKNCSRQATLTSTKTSDQILKERVCDKMSFSIKLSDKLYDLFHKVHLAYRLGAPGFSKSHDLYLFLDRVQFGDIVLPEHSIDTSPIFDSRDEFLRFSEAAQYKNELVNAFDNKKRDTMFEICQVVFSKLQELLKSESVPNKPPHLLCFTPGAKYVNALSFGTEHLVSDHALVVKRWLELLLSQHVYSQNKRGFWYNQLAMIETKYFKQFDAAAKIVIEGLKDPALTEVALHDLTARGLMIVNSKKNKINDEFQEQIRPLLVEAPDSQQFPSLLIDAHAMRNEMGGKRTYVEMQNDGARHFLTVENIALSHYLKNGGFTNGIHCEGTLFVAIFFILFWDVIYNVNVPQTFINEIQSVPLDLFSSDFYENRKNHVEKRLQEIKIDWTDDELQLFIITNWNKHSHKKSLLIKSVVQDAKELIEIVSCIKREPLSLVLQRLAMNFGMHQSGLPDLFLWNFHQTKCRCVEVKGEKDKLSTKQKLWLSYLRSVGVEIEVCHVHTVGSKGSEKIKRLKKRLTENPPL